LGRVLRWPRHTNGPREKGAAPVARIFRGSPINSSFSFLSHDRYNFSPVSGGRAFIHFEANARRERRDARYVKQKRARSSSGTKKGFKKHLFKVSWMRGDTKHGRIAVRHVRRYVKKRMLVQQRIGSYCTDIHVTRTHKPVPFVGSLRRA
jgi:hypothetical protein